MGSLEFLDTNPLLLAKKSTLLASRKSRIQNPDLFLVHAFGIGWKRLIRYNLYLLLFIALREIFPSLFLLAL